MSNSKYSSQEGGSGRNLVIGILAIGILGVFGASLVPMTRHYNDGKGIKVLGATSAATDVKLIENGKSQVIVQGITGAKSDLSVKQDKNQLIVTTPQGPKTLSVLPDDAVKNLSGAKVMSDVVSQSVSNSLGNINQLITLKDQDNVLGYEISGVKKAKVFNIIPVNSNVVAFVSAENGQIVQTRESLLGLLLNKISF